MKTVDASGLKTLLDGNEDVLLVNTLKAESFEKTRIPGAVNIPLEDEDFVARVGAASWRQKQVSSGLLREPGMQLV